MSTIEERLARDIAAVTGGVVVTESDLKDARDVVEGGVERRRQRDRRRLAVAAVAAIVIPAVGFVAFQALGGDDKSAPPVNPGPTAHADPYAGFLAGSAPTPELLEGVWRVDNGTTVLRFSRPDLISIDSDGRLFADPGIQGTYAVAGDLITVSVDGGTAGCAGQTFAIRASLPENGAMRFVHTQPGTGNCVPQFVQVDDPPSSYDDVSWALEQMLPTKNKFLARIDHSSARHWKPLTDKNAMPGDWLAEGGGNMLELTPGGDYSLAAESGDVVDRGRWSQRGAELTLTSSAASRTCSGGDRLVLGNLEQVHPGTTVMRGTVEQNACGGAWATKTWVLIPHVFN
jgi:hypothetical protein